MKLNKSKIFVSIWGIHLFIYYSIYLFSSAIANNHYTELYKILFGFTLGIMGWLEQIPAFFIIPILIMLILIRTKLKNKWFLAYALSINSAYLANYLWIFSNNKHTIIPFSLNSTNLIYFIIPSLLGTIILNWFIFKNKYKKMNI